MPPASIVALAALGGAAPGSILALAALGAFHGLNPAMGWLFAVGRGMQEGSRALLLASLPSIAAGHALSVGVVAVAVTVTGSVTTASAVAIGGGVLLVGFGLWRLLSRRHFRWSGMRLSLWQLAGWSFLMSSAHGAGLMLLPVLTAGATSGTASGHDHAPTPGTPDPSSATSGTGGPDPGSGTSDAGSAMADAGSAAMAGVFATGVHTLAMFLVAGIIAVLVYEFVGLRVLRYAWFNLDRLWAAALILAGLLTLATTLLNGG